MFQRILGKDSKIILKNFSYLSLMKTFNIGIKLVLVLYLIRVLGDENYGLVTWLDSIIQYFLMFINFGFNIYAAKYIVDNLGDKEKLDEIVSSILTIKSAIFLASVIIILFMGGAEAFQYYRNALLLFILSGLGEVLFPIWYFQGRENLRPATIIVFLSRLLLVLGVLVFVKAEDDTTIYILLLTISSIVMGVFGFAYIVKYYGFNLVLVPVVKLWYFIKESTPFFLGRFLSLIFNFGTIFLIGRFCNLSEVAGFDIALKVIIVGTIPYEMLQQALFPTLTRNQDRGLLKKVIWFSIISGVIIGVLVYIFATNLMMIFGGDSMVFYDKALKALALMTPFIALTFVLGSCALVAFGHFKEYNISLIGTSIIYLGVVLVLWLLDSITFWNLVYLRIAGEIIMSLIRLYYTLKKRVLVLR